MFGEEAAELILAGKVWKGETEAMVAETFGAPAEIDEKILKTKTKRVLKYFWTGANRYLLRITIEKGVVVLWTDRRVSPVV